MIPEEAIAEIRESGLYGNQVHMETLELALEALEKQIPKKPIYGEIDYRTEDNFLGKKINCGVCSENISYENSVIEYFKYCSHCGSKIDWSEEE